MRSHKPPDECECKVLSNLKKKQDKRQERPTNTDWMIVIMRRRFSLVSVTVITLVNTLHMLDEFSHGVVVVVSRATL